jgi:hypothetical protein
VHTLGSTCVRVPPTIPLANATSPRAWRCTARGSTTTACRPLASTGESLASVQESTRSHKHPLQSTRSHKHPPPCTHSRCLACQRSLMPPHNGADHSRERHAPMSTLSHHTQNQGHGRPPREGGPRVRGSSAGVDSESWRIVLALSSEQTSIPPEHEQRPLWTLRGRTRVSVVILGV